MSEARDSILAALDRQSPPAVPPPAPMPPRVRAGDLVARFVAAATAASCTVERLTDADGVDAAIAAFLQRHQLPARVWLSGDPPVAAAGILAVAPAGEPLPADGGTVVTGCFAALAEEGAVVLCSGPRHAADSVFRARNHVVVVRESQLLAGLGDLWAPLRAAARPWPRLVNVIRGPSRTADLGVPSRLGAHGPLRVHVLLLRG